MASRRHPVPGESQILVICTGNLCRSPMAEGLLVHALAAGRSDIRVASAGTQAAPGHPMERHAAAQLSRLTASLPDFRTRLLTDELIGDADLVLTATRDHRAAVARLAPDAAARAFTLGELARLLEDVSVPSQGVTPAELAVLAAARRGRVRPAPEKDDDLPDPFGRSRLAYARCADRLVRLLAPPLEALLGSAVPAGNGR